MARRTIKNAVGSFGLQITYIGSSLITSILLARFLGTEGYGTYAYVMNWIFLLQIPAGLGLRNILVREVAAYQIQSEWSLMKGILLWANKAVLIASLGIALLTAAIAWLLAADSNPQMLLVFWLALVSLPLFALTAIRQGAMQGLHRVVMGQLPEYFVEPVLFIILIISAYFFVEKNLTVTWVMAARVLTIGLAFSLGTTLLRNSLPKFMLNVSPDYQISRWAYSILPFIFITSMYEINNKTDILMLGAMKGTEAVGLYVVASRGAQLIIFVMIAVDKSLGPTIANLYSAKNIEQLQRIVTKSARLMFWASLPISLGFIVFGKLLLLLVFGSEFVQANMALAILSFGQIVNVATGSVGILLNMTGHERETAIGVGTSAVLNVILNAILIPQWGIEGAAIATSVSRVYLNFLLVYTVHKKLGIYPTFLGKVYSI